MQPINQKLFKKQSFTQKFYEVDVFKIPSNKKLLLYNRPK